MEVKHGISDDYEYTEAIKTLRTNLQFCGTGIKVIMFTSSMPDEGKKRYFLCNGRRYGADRQKDAAD